MVTCIPVADGGRWQEGQADGELQQPRKLSSSASSVSSRTLVYDVGTGSLRYSKPSCRAGVLQPRSPKSPRSPASSLKLELENQHVGEVVDSHCSSPLGKQFHSERFFESGESSPTCVIQNSALRSNSSSPTMSTISKCSSDAGRSFQDNLAGVSFPGSKPLNVTTRSSPELDKEIISSGSKSPRTELSKVGDVRERIKKLESINSTSGKPGLKGPAVLRRVEHDSKENNAGWSMPHDPSQNPPFKSIQCAMAMEAASKKSKHGGIPVSRLADSSIMNSHKSPGIFSFNATYMSRVPDSDLDFDFDDPIRSHAVTTAPSATTKVVVSQQQLDVSRRTFITPLLKPTPSKWDDAEKWLPGSENQSARAKSRSGPLLSQMVAAQAGMSIPWKGSQIASSQTERQCTPGLALGQRGQDAAEVGSSGSEAADVKDVQTQEEASTPSTPGRASSLPGLIDFTADEKEQLNLLLDRYAVQSLKAGELGLPSDGSISPSSLKGSFLKLGARTDKPGVVDFSAGTGDYNSKNALDLDSKSNSTRVSTRDMGTEMTQKGDYNSANTPDLDSKPNFARVATRDMGTAMTPISSVEPSRTSTPVKRKGEAAAAVEIPKETTKETTKSTTPVEFPMTEKEFQEKTRQEIVALGTQLGKANIAATWTAREREQQESAVVKLRSSNTLNLETLRRDVFASRADAWQEAEKLKYTTRFEQEKAKIQVWEEHEKAKAEAELRRIELKAERMKAQAHEKLDQKLATMQRQAEELRSAAESRRAEAAKKVARKAEILKANGRITNLLFLSYLCT